MGSGVAQNINIQKGTDESRYSHRSYQSALEKSSTQRSIITKTKTRTIHKSTEHPGAIQRPSSAIRLEKLDHPSVRLEETAAAEATQKEYLTTRASAVGESPLKSTKRTMASESQMMATSGVTTGRKKLDIVQAKRLAKESDFLTSYRQLEDLDREKEIKFFQCIGDAYITEEETAAIRDHRQKVEEERRELLCHQDCVRYQVETDRERVTVDALFMPLQKPSWDIYRNDDFAVRKKSLIRFMRAAKTILIRHRAGKRLKKIKKFILENNIQSREKAKEVVKDDWKKAEALGLDDNEFVAFSFNLGEENLMNFKFPVQFERNADNFRQKVDTTPITNFEDMNPIDLIERQDFEVMGYKEFARPQAPLYVPQELERELRQGAEDELHCRSMRGEPKNYLIAETELTVPENMLKDVLHSLNTLVLPHPTIRPYYTFVSHSEVDPEYYLYPEQRTRITKYEHHHAGNDADNYTIRPETFTKGRLSVSKYGQNLTSFSEIPGLSGVRVISRLDSLSGYYRHKRTLPVASYCDDYLEFEPQPLTGIRDVDLMSDSDSDSGNVFEMKVGDVDALLNEFEEGDEVLKRIDDKAKNHGDGCYNIREEAIELLNHNIASDRLHASTILPTRLNNTNEHIIEPQNKVALK
eukprot:CAMPEP_0115010078 /NCGR_PEP_ID=MMETSP0216-20121206/23065_1 /TAXON_ID=223996 /ORGANISM="Protocruzia adherens, Strain Boccale" /LENGTH=639 /DNA_ID=CAMNT_0002378151 /DNA_START=305 /DNA_END=2224 /DNA_ORIENTATION=-